MATHTDNPARAFPMPKGPLAVVGIFSLVSNLLMLAVPLYIFQLFDRVVTSRSVDTLVLLSVMTLAALAVQGLLDLIRGRMMVRLGLRFEGALSRRLLLALIGKSGRGSIASGQNLRDLQEVRGFFTGNALITLLDVPWIPVYVVVVYLFHPALGALAFFGAALLFVMAALNNWLTGVAIKRVGETSAVSFAEADGYLRNAEVIRAMGMAGRLASRWQRGNTASVIAFAQATDIAGLLSVAAKVSRLILQMAVMGLGIYLLIDKSVTGGAVMAASILLARALAPIEMAITTWRVISSARAAWQRLAATLAEAGRASDPMPLPVPRGELTIERANVLVPGAAPALLRGIDFRLAAGETLGILGPSGSGKSTLCRVLVGLQPVVPGTVRLDGSELRAWNQEQLGRHIGYLPQDVQLLAGTVRENIARMQADAPSEEVIAAAMRAGVHDMIVRLPEGYETYIGEAGGVLSGGERQRIALARALYGNPRLIVLDEPNAHLDVFGEDALVRAMADAKERGATVVIVSHRPSVMNRADKLLVLRNGMMEQFGPAEEVLRRIRGAAAKPTEVEGRNPKQVSPVGGSGAAAALVRAQQEG